MTLRIPLPENRTPDRAPECGRLAPSPTGGLHLGNARTFLIAWLTARRASGRIVFRMEDLDAGRARKEAAAAAVDDLRWLGLDWDEGPDVGGPDAPYEQSLRTDFYSAALDRLIASESIYPCTCTRAEAARMASAPHAEDEPPSYPGTCAGRSATESKALDAAGRPYAWRFRTSGETVAWIDEVRGPQLHDFARIGGDFIVARSGGVFSYQLAVVVDDAAMGITQVIRGHDLVVSTPRQRLLQAALGLPCPRYWHVGLVLGPEGKRLAKRDQAVKIGNLRARGIPPDVLVGALARSLGISTEACLPKDLLSRWPVGSAAIGDDCTIDLGDFGPFGQ